MSDLTISCKLYFAIKLLFRLLPLWLLTGCMSFKASPQSFCDPCNPIQCNTLSHPLYQTVPRHRSQIRWYDIPHWGVWMLFGNDDDGIFGEEACFLPNKPPSLHKAVQWNLRNPLHNFFFYTIGSAHRCNSEFTLLRISQPRLELFRYRSHASTVFADKDSSFYMALHGGKPFISLRLCYSRTRKFDFYLGWRERGNFGLKLLPFSKRKDKVLLQDERIDSMLITNRKPERSNGGKEKEI